MCLSQYSLSQHDLALPVKAFSIRIKVRERVLPTNKPGSSIMLGKVNPTYVKQSVASGKHFSGINNIHWRSDACTVPGTAVLPAIFLVEENVTTTAMWCYKSLHIHTSIFATFSAWLCLLQKVSTLILNDRSGLKYGFINSNGYDRIFLCSSSSVLALAQSSMQQRNPTDRLAISLAAFSDGSSTTQYG